MVIMLLLLHEICAVEIEINPISLYREISDETLGALLLSVRPSKEAVEDFTAAMDPEYSPFPIYHSIFDHRRSVTEVEDYISAWILYPHLHHITIPIWRLRSYFQVSLGRVDLDQSKLRHI